MTECWPSPRRSVPMHRCVEAMASTLSCVGFNVVAQSDSTNSLVRFVMEADLVQRYWIALQLAGQRDVTLGTDGTTTYTSRHFQSAYLRWVDERGELRTEFLDMLETQGQKNAGGQLEVLEDMLAEV